MLTALHTQVPKNLFPDHQYTNFSWPDALENLAYKWALSLLPQKPKNKILICQLIIDQPNRTARCCYG